MCQPGFLPPGGPEVKGFVVSDAEAGPLERYERFDRARPPGSNAGARGQVGLLWPMVFLGLGTATPPRRYTQNECWEAAQKAKQFDQLTSRSRAILRKILTGSNGISSRHLALDDMCEAFDLTPDALHARFAQHAPRLAAQAADRALTDSGENPEAIDALIVSTCTGYLCPGLTSYLVEGLGLRPEILALDLVGQGCGAAVPNLRTAEALLRSGRCARVLSVCVEVCSAAFYLDNDPGVLVSACLFGDGAGAAVLAREPNGHRRIEWKASGTRMNPCDRDLLRFEQKQGMLRNLLSPEVPRRAADQVARVLDQVLQAAGVDRGELAAWILHPGGRDVLLAIKERVGLRDEDLRWSAAVLEEYGNLSSPSLFFVLQAALAGAAPGGHWWLSSFGAGFSAHGVLVEVGR